jgi:HEAT repeat protein
MKQVALESLTTSKAPNIVPTLAGKLSRWDAATQRAVIECLGRRGDVAATAAIVAAVKHQDPDVRAAAIDALSRLPGTAEIASVLLRVAVDAESDDARIARQALARLDGPAVGPAILAGAERGETRGRVVQLELLALRNMTEALPLLLKMRDDPDPVVRTAAVGALGEIGSATEQKALLDWTVQAKDPSEQSRALRSLVGVTLRNPDEDSRGRAVFAAIESAPPELALRLLPVLSRLGDRPSADAAARLAIRDDAAVSEAATTALARWNDANAIPALATVAEKAARSEARLAATNGVLAHFERQRESWSTKDTAVVGRLLASSEDADTRRKLVALLHRAQDKQALALADKLKSDAVLGREATTAAEVIQANLAGPPKLRASNPSGVANIIDGKSSTRWSTPALGEEWLEIDFRVNRPFRRITLDQTGRAAEFPERYEVYVTDDPKQPGAAVASGVGQRQKTVIEVPSGTRGRYVVVKNVAERSETPWAVCELYVE